MTQLDPIVNALYLDINGLNLSNDATTPNTKIDVSAGQARDSNNIIDMNLGNWLNQGNPTFTANSATVLNMLVNGFNGLDTGSIAASTTYYIYIIGDSSNKHIVGVIASLSAVAPYLPFGYDSFRLLGFIQTDGSSHILPFIGFENGNLRYMQFGAPIAITVTSSGTSATYSALDLSPAVTVSNFGVVQVQYKWTPAAPADVLNFSADGVSDSVTILGIAAGVAQSGSFPIVPKLVSSVPTIWYKVSAGTLNNVWVQALQVFL